MRSFNKIENALTYAKLVLGANAKQAEKLRQDLEKKAICKFNGLVILYDPFNLLY